MKPIAISTNDISFCLANALDLVSPRLTDHHLKVASLSLSLSTELGFSEDEQLDISLAALLHDTGALSLNERFKLLKFDNRQTREHCELGYRLFKKFAPFTKIAELIHYHHTFWEDGKGAEVHSEKIHMGCHIIHLADRIAVLTPQLENVLEHIGGISEIINNNSGNMFVPEYVEAFNSLASKKSFWLNSYSLYKYDHVYHKSQSRMLHLNEENLLNLAQVFCQIIDFKSQFTATHSSGVAAIAESIAKNIDFSQKELLFIKLGGYLHDLGKLAVPVEILEKPGKLTRQEFDVIQSHTYYSFYLINLIPEFACFKEWASFHHEAMDGQGYPFKVDGDSLSLGSRVMSVADKFTALTEDRPYRAGMPSEKAMEILKSMAKEDKLDAFIVRLLEENIDEINSVRLKSQKTAQREYQQFSHFPKAA